MTRAKRFAFISSAIQSIAFTTLLIAGFGNSILAAKAIAMPTEHPQPVNGNAEGSQYRPAWDDCEAIEMEMAYRLGLTSSPLSQDAQPFRNFVTGQIGMSCQLKGTTSNSNYGQVT